MQVVTQHTTLGSFVVEVGKKDVANLFLGHLTTFFLFD